VIRELIVVEGWHDKQVVEQAVEADIVITGGSAVSKALLKELERARQTRGIIIFTDPDHAGERIRRMISKRIEGCKHAFLPMSKATAGHDIGIENARGEDIRDALARVRTEVEPLQPLFARIDLVDWGLDGQPQAASRREAVGAILGIGYGNAKSFCNKLNMLGVTRKELQTALARVLDNENNMAAGELK